MSDMEVDEEMLAVLQKKGNNYVLYTTYACLKLDLDIQ